MVAIRLLFGVMAVTLTACGGGGATTPPPPPPPPPVVSQANVPPVVNAGTDASVTAQSSVTLFGTATDTDGDSLTYEWTQDAGPSVDITNATSTSPSFVAPDGPEAVNLSFTFRATDTNGASSADDVEIIVNPMVQSSQCNPLDVPESLRDAPYALDSFYQKYCDASGLPVLGSTMVREKALVEAVDRTLGMIGTLDSTILDAMIANNTRIAIMAESEVTTDIPEHSDLYTAFPGTDWDNRARGLGATNPRPASSAGEENLLCLSTDVFFGEDIFVHEFAHTIHVMGLNNIDGSFEAELTRSYNSAIESGLWEDTYAATNIFEYWAEGVQSYYDVNQDPFPGVHNEIDTRAELKTYDPQLHDLIELYLNPDYSPTCPE